jgi:hypothetical protein
MINVDKNPAYPADAIAQATFTAKLFGIVA